MDSNTHNLRKYIAKGLFVGIILLPYAFAIGYFQSDRLNNKENNTITLQNTPATQVIQPTIDKYAAASASEQATKVAVAQSFPEIRHLSGKEWVSRQNLPSPDILLKSDFVSICLNEKDALYFDASSFPWNPDGQISTLDYYVVSDGCGVWSPDRTKMAQTNYVGNTDILIRSRTEGSANILVDNSILKGSKSELAWSPDGNKLYFFLMDIYSDMEKSGLYVLDFTQTSNSIIPKQVSKLFGRPIVSPDNNYIALEPYNIQDGKVTIISQSGTVVWESPSTFFGVRDLVWAPDSKKLFFTKYSDDATSDFPNFEIASLDIQSKSVDVFGMNIRNVYSPKFSPDGQWLFFKTFPLDDNKEYGIQIYGESLYRIKIDKSEIVKIAHCSSLSLLGWLPDRTHFVFLDHGNSSLANSSKLYVEDISNSEQAFYIELTATYYVRGDYIVWLPSQKR
jgi:Tol biopolymer transport system component